VALRGLPAQVGQELNMDTTHAFATPSHEIRFESLFNQGRGLVFPCDEAGHVDIDALSERGRNNYFFARAMFGREYASPRVVPLRR
jgi:hypothetical protein